MFLGGVSFVDMAKLVDLLKKWLEEYIQVPKYISSINLQNLIYDQKVASEVFHMDK